MFAYVGLVWGVNVGMAIILYMLLRYKIYSVSGKGTLGGEWVSLRPRPCGPGSSPRFRVSSELGGI